MAKNSRSVSSRSKSDPALKLWDQLAKKHGWRAHELRTGIVRDQDRTMWLQNFNTGKGHTMIAFIAMVPLDSKLGKAWAKHYDKLENKKEKKRGKSKK